MLTIRWSDIRTLGNPSTVVAAILVVVVLSLLIVETRAVKTDYYVSHAERARAIEAAEAGLVSAVADMTAAFETGVAVSPSVELSFERLRDNNQVLQALHDVPRHSPQVQSQLEQFDSSLAGWFGNSEVYIARQNAKAAALQSLQENSPNLVRELRQRGLTDQSRALFAIALDTIEYATGQGPVDAIPLRDRIKAIRNDAALQTDAPETTAAFLDTANTVVAEHLAAVLMLAAVENSTVAADLAQLDGVLSDFNSDTVGRVETARVLLSVCAVLLLIGVAYSIYRLQSSYHDLDDSNKALQLSNDTLEQRVSERTEQLETAYDDLKESQVKLIHAEKMSSLGELIAGVSHEINTPLWYLMSNSSVIQERLEAMDDLCDVVQSVLAAALSGAEGRDRVRQGLSDMHRLMQGGIKGDIQEARQLIQDSIDGLDDMATLAKGLKDFSRKDRSQYAPFNVNDGLDKSLIIVKNRIKNRITVHKYYDDVPTIYCSPSQINQIFLNLLTNAADAIEDLGDIVIQTREENGSVIINIGDTGAGIPADVLPRIRDPFFTTKEVGQGTGLGLSIVDQIVTAHNGELHIESMPGKGTTISVALPIVEEGGVVIEPEDRIDLPEILSVDLVATKRDGLFLGETSDAGDRLV